MKTKSIHLTLIRAKTTRGASFELVTGTPERELLQKWLTGPPESITHDLTLSKKKMLISEVQCEV